jgi:RNA polymerase sigma factor (TIGR02999 family)
MSDQPDPPADLSATLRRVAKGDRAAYDAVFSLAYRDLVTLARQVRSKMAGTPLNTTGIVHECYLRLLGSPARAADQQHFLAIAATAMRHLLIEQARAVGSAKRGGGATPVTLSAIEEAIASNADELIDIDRLLKRLAAHSPQQVAIVECRYFAGLSDPETAAALDLPLRTVQREWSRVREWMLAQAALDAH